MTGDIHEFGPELRRRRMQADVSLGEFARRLHYNKGYLSRVECGIRRPSVELARRCDAALCADGELAHLVDVPPPRARATCVDPLTCRPPDGLPWSADRDEMQPPRTATAGPTTDQSVLANFRNVLTHLRRRGRLSSPRAVLPSVVAELSALSVVATEAPPPVRLRCLLLAAEVAEFAGWMAEDAGDVAGATAWTRQAVAYAQASGDADLPAHALVRLANAAMYDGDGRRTVDLACTAQERRSASSRIRGLAALREAQGHAVLGDTAPCLRAVERGRTLLAADVVGTTSALGLNSVPDPSELVLGWCLFDLGQAAHAVDVLSAEVGRIPAEARRSRGRFATRLARAQAAVGDVTGVAATAATALTDAAAVDSATIRADVRGLAKDLARWPRNAAVRRLHPLLVDVLRAAV